MVYKFVQALGSKHLHPDEYKNLMLNLLDLVTIATIADVVPIKDENYALLKFGLKTLEKTVRPGIVELKRVSGLLDGTMTPISVGFYLAPRINAAGRLEDATLSMELLLSSDRPHAAQLANRLDQLNVKRCRKNTLELRNTFWMRRTCLTIKF